MGFKFFKLNSINKSHSYLSSISSKPYKNSIFTLQNPSKIQSFTTLLHFHHPLNSQTFKSCHLFHFQHDHCARIPSKSRKNSDFTLQNPPKFQLYGEVLKQGHFGHFEYDHCSKIPSKFYENSDFTLQNPPNFQVHGESFNGGHFGNFHHDKCSRTPLNFQHNSIFTLQNPSNSQYHGETLKQGHFGHFEHDHGSKFPSKPNKNVINQGHFGNFKHYDQSSRTLQNSIFTLQNPSKFIQDPPNSLTLKRGHFGHSHHGHGGSENVFRWGLAADVGLTVGKAVTGYLSGSTAIIADAAHSLSDVVLSSVALLSYKAARVPRDKEHPYGHGKFETLGALGISGMLLVTAGGIAWHAADILLGLYATSPETVLQSSANHHEHHHGGHTHQIDMSHPFLALSMAIVSIGVKEGLFWITKKAGDTEGSGLMTANAWHHRADAISSFVALIGVGGAILGVRFLDPLAGLLVSGMILKAGLESGHQSIMELVDAAVPQQLLDPHRKTILQVDGVKGCHRLRGRRAGSFIHLDVHIEVDSFASVSAAHHIGENVRRQIHKSHPEVAEVFIHIDPLIPQISQDVPACADGADDRNASISLEQNDINTIISGIFSSQFSERMTVEHIRPHLLCNKILLDVQVSMPPNIVISDAMQMAEEAKKEILHAISNAVQVNIQLRLSHPNHHKTP
ncbi:hypothetical protein vseg_010525 [Gypsophila vaccaria]